jgi:hypothetical protein
VVRFRVRKFRSDESGSLGDLLKETEVVDVNRPRLVPAVKSDFLGTRETRRCYSVDNPVVERVGGVVEMATVPIGLPPMAGGVEHHRVEIHPAAAWRSELHSHRAPVRLDVVSTVFECGDRSTFVIGINGKIKVTMRTRLMSDEGVDSPSASDPDTTTDSA